MRTYKTLFVLAFLLSVTLKCNADSIDLLGNKSERCERQLTYQPNTSTPEKITNRQDNKIQQNKKNPSFCSAEFWGKGFRGIHNYITPDCYDDCLFELAGGRKLPKSYDATLEKYRGKAGAIAAIATVTAAATAVVNIATQAASKNLATTKFAATAGSTAAAVNSCPPRLHTLIYNRTQKIWISARGLVYGQGSAHGNRVKHVLDHLVARPSKRIHTIFTCTKNQLFALIDKAWISRIGSGNFSRGKHTFIVEMGKVIGTAGETSIKLVVKYINGKPHVITAYPV